MRRARPGFVSLLAVGLGACGPAAVVPPPQSTPVDIAAPSAPSASATATGPDLSPVSEPADVVGIARWRSPIATISNLAACAGVAPVVVEVNARWAVASVLRELVRGVDARELAGLVALDAPVDVLVTLDPEERPRPPYAAIAIGLSSIDGAKLAVDKSGELPEVAPGVWRLKNSRGAACAIAASAGATPARLVCAERDRALTALAPYLARTAPSLDLGGPDMHVEARLATARKRYGAALQGMLRILPDAMSAEYGIDDERFDRLLFESGSALQVEASSLLADVRTVTAEVKSERSGTCLRVTSDLDLASATSWTARTLGDRLDRSGPPPAIFWRQPKDSDVAAYGRGVDSAQYTAVLTRLRELLDAALAKESVPAADRKKVIDLVALPFGKDTVTVFSHGHVDVPMPQPGSKDVEKRVNDAALTRLVGWTMIGAAEGPAAMKKQLKALTEAYKAPGVQKWLKKEAGSDADSLPIVKSTAAPATLGAGAEALEITIPNINAPRSRDQDGNRSAAIKTSFKIHVLLMADGDTTWLAIGGAKDELVKRLLAAKTGAPDKDQLTTRGDLEPLRNGRQMSAGFLSAAPFSHGFGTLVSAISTVDPGSLPAQMTTLAGALALLPNKGQTPVIFAMNGSSSAQGTKIGMSFEVQQGTFEDTKAIAVSAYSVFSRMGIFP